MIFILYLQMEVHIYMKNINFTISNGDVNAISCALSVLPSYDFFDDVSPDLSYLPVQIIRKLNAHKPLNQKEIRLIAIAVDSAQKALRGEMSLDDEALCNLRQYLFTINKLSASFSVLLDSE